MVEGAVFAQKKTKKKNSVNGSQEVIWLKEKKMNEDDGATLDSPGPD